MIQECGPGRHPHLDGLSIRLVLATAIQCGFLLALEVRLRRGPMPAY